MIENHLYPNTGKKTSSTAAATGGIGGIGGTGGAVKSSTGSANTGTKKAVNLDNRSGGGVSYSSGTGSGGRSSGGGVTTTKPEVGEAATPVPQTDPYQAALDEVRRQSLSNLQRENEYSAGLLQGDADQALREAYIARMQQERMLPEQMARQGMTGGLSESTLAAMGQNYQSGRNGIYRDLLAKNAELANQYQGNVAGVENQYLQNMADYALAQKQMDWEKELLKYQELLNNPSRARMYERYGL